MRTKKQIFMLLLALLVGIPTLSAQQSKKEKKEQKKEAVMKLIESENYKIDVNTAMPMRGRSIPLTSSYSLTIRNDSVISYLPYYGRAYSIPYGGGDGLNFKAILKEYNVEMDKKGNAVIKFVARNPEDRYEFRAKVFPNGSASIDVNMQNRQSISFQGELDTYENGLIIEGQKIPVFSESDAALIPWGACGAEYIIDATGAYCTTEKAKAHLEGGAKKVIISAPAKDGDTPTFIMGINHDKYTSDMPVVSNASCTTNCLAPICKVLEDNYGIEYGLMSTIHAATAKQKVVDSRSQKDWRTGRSAFGNLIPSTTGAAKAISLVIPALKDKMSGISYRVPTSDVSIVDLNVALKQPASYDEICKKVREASETYLSGILDYVEDEVVSSDFIGDSHASIFDARQGIQVNSHFFKVICFYDNEWGYTSQIFRLIEHMDRIDHNR